MEKQILCIQGRDGKLKVNPRKSEFVIDRKRGRFLDKDASGDDLMDNRLCDHPQVSIRLFYSGGIATHQGEYDDDIIENVVCLKCGYHVKPRSKPGRRSKREEIE